MKSPLEIAISVLITGEAGEFISSVLNEQRLTDSERQNAFIRELVYGTLRWRGQIDFVLTKLCKYPLHSLPAWTRNSLRAGIYQLAYMHTLLPHDIVNQTVTVVGKHGHKGVKALVNGVLRNFLRGASLPELLPADSDAPETLSIRFSHPTWLINRWISRFGIAETRKLMEWNNQLHPLSLRINTLKSTTEQVQEALRTIGFEASPSQRLPNCLLVAKASGLFATASYANGEFTIQEESSQLVCFALHPQKGERILDVCCGLGGKSTHIAELTADSAQIFSVDRDKRALDKFKDHIRRLSLSAIAPIHGAINEISSLERESFDKVLVDAPCSSIGTINRHPEIKWNRDQQILTQLHEEQVRLLQDASKYCKKAGVLLYAVCSFEPEETIDVIAAFLASNPDFNLTPISFICYQSIVPEENDGRIFILPQRHQCGGFFIAHMSRNR